MKNLPPIYTEKTECQDCYKCLRECPLKSIGVADGTATILLEDCVFCGKCTRICPANAKRIRNDLPKVKDLFTQGRPVYASIAPSVLTEFPTTALPILFSSIRALGFAAVEETAHGADMASQAVMREMKAKSSTQKLFISTACPSIVAFIKRYMPKFAQYLTEAPSPLYFHASSLREKYGQEISVVFIGPCAAKKCESDEWPEVVSAAIGFSDLNQWFADVGIDLTNMKEEPLAELEDRPAKGLLYPFDSGMCLSLKSLGIEQEVPDVRCLHLSGLEDVKSALESLDVENLSQPVFLELLACKGGCINGPMTKKSGDILGKQLLLEAYEANLHDRTPRLPLSLSIKWQPKVVANDEMVSVERTQEALHSVGKYQPEDELNCSGCGYDSCRDFAKALAQGKAEKTMCVSYMKKLAQKKADGLMRSIPSGVVIVDSDLIVMESNERFAKMLGGEVEQLFMDCPGLGGAVLKSIINVDDYLLTVLNTPGIDLVTQNINYGDKIFHASFFTIQKGAAAGIIFQDFTVPWIRRDRIIEQAQKVIEKNVSTVQQIAYLLGENAAETEVILNSMIQSFSQKDDLAENTGE